MTAFVDSSALVKLYADEDGASAIRRLDAMVVSAVARVEVPAAVWRKARMRQLDAADARVLIDDFEADWHGTLNADPRFAAVAVTGNVLESSAHLAAVHGLRAYDAIQLGSAITARAAAPRLRVLAAFDAALRDAAAAEGFTLLPR